MSLQRPDHLTARQMQGRAFSEAISIIRTAGDYNAYGEFEETETPSPSLCATAPSTGQRPQERRLMEGGVALSDMRIFWTVEALDPLVEGQSAGDLVEFGGERFRIRASDNWGGFSESIGVRQEGQGEPDG